MNTTSVLTKCVLPIEELTADDSLQACCAIAAAESSPKPHRGFREDLIHHPQWAADVFMPAKWGYDAPPVAYRTFHDATLLGYCGAVVTSDGDFVAETIVAERVRDPTLQALEQAKRNASSSAEVVSETCLLAGHGSHCVFGHFMLETMLSVYALDPLIKSKAIKVIMPLRRRNWAHKLLDAMGVPRSTKRNWPHALLDAVGVPREARIELDRTSTRFKTLIVANTCSGEVTFRPNEFIREFAHHIRCQLPVSSNKYRLFLTRSGATTTSRRNINNEAELSKALCALGFMVVDPGRLSFMQQVELFAHAEMIVGVHGSAFANVIFAPEGCIVGEILPDYWAGIGGGWIGNLTNLCGLQYFYVMAKSERRGKGYVVDVEVAVVIDRVRLALNEPCVATSPTPQSNH